jgi:hypothetical protein
MKQTAVEWLEEQFEESYSYINEIFKETIKQAKEMEKKQIETAYNKAVPFKYGKEYYEETFTNPLKINPK